MFFVDFFFTLFCTNFLCFEFSIPFCNFVTLADLV